MCRRVHYSAELALYFWEDPHSKSYHGGKIYLITSKIILLQTYQFSASINDLLLGCEYSAPYSLSFNVHARRKELM